MANAYPTGFQGDHPEETAKDRGVFDCFGKKEGTDDVHVPAAEAQHKPSMMEKLHRSNSNSSSSSDEEVEENGIKIKRKKNRGLTDKIKEKLPGHKNEGPAVVAAGDYNHPHAAAANAEGIHPGEKKGFTEKIKEKIPGQHKGEAAHVAHPAPGAHYGATPAPSHYDAAPAPSVVAAPAPVIYGEDGHGHQAAPAHEPHEKKGIIEKIKEKLPGGHKDGHEVKKDHY